MLQRVALLYPSKLRRDWYLLVGTQMGTLQATQHFCFCIGSMWMKQRVKPRAPEPCQAFKIADLLMELPVWSRLQTSL